MNELFFDSRILSTICRAFRTRHQVSGDNYETRENLEFYWIDWWEFTL